MSKKFLKQLNFDEAKQLLFQNGETKGLVEEIDWEKNKINGNKMISIIDGKHQLVISNIKKNFNLNDQ